MLQLKSFIFYSEKKSKKKKWDIQYVATYPTSEAQRKKMFFGEFLPESHTNLDMNRGKTGRDPRHLQFLYVHS